MIKRELIELSNQQIKFKIGSKTILIRRIFIESKFGLYWFSGNLYNEIISLYNSNKEWFNKYRI